MEAWAWAWLCAGCAGVPARAGRCRRAQEEAGGTPGGAAGRGRGGSGIKNTASPSPFSLRVSPYQPSLPSLPLALLALPYPPAWRLALCVYGWLYRGWWCITRAARICKK